MKNITTLTTIIVFAAISMVPAAAQTATKPHAKRGNVEVRAHGDGEVVLRGEGAFSAEGNGQLRIVAANKKQIHVKGFTFVRQEGNAYLYEGKGKAVVRGKNIELDLTGTVRHMAAGGEGTARLIGNGEFTAKNTKGTWSKPGVDVKF